MQVHDICGRRLIQFLTLVFVSLMFVNYKWHTSIANVLLCRPICTCGRSFNSMAFKFINYVNWLIFHTIQYDTIQYDTIQYNSVVELNERSQIGLHNKTQVIDAAIHQGTSLKRTMSVIDEEKR